MIDTKNADKFNNLMRALSGRRPMDPDLADLWILARTEEGGTDNEAANYFPEEDIDRLEEWVDDVHVNLADYCQNVYDYLDGKNCGINLPCMPDPDYITSWRANMELVRLEPRPENDSFVEIPVENAGVRLFAEPDSFDWRHAGTTIHGVLIVNRERREFTNPEDMGSALVELINKREHEQR